MGKFFLGMFAGIAALVGAALAAEHFGYWPISTDVSTSDNTADMESCEMVKTEEAEASKESTETEEV